MRAFSRCLVAAAVSLAACASQTVDHSFSFNAVWDSPDVYVLDYRYGDSRLPMARNPEDLRVRGDSLQSTSINGPMRRGDTLYVKWRVKSTGQVYEDTVDLVSRLPKDITDHRIYFIIQGPQLYVYLIPPNDRRRPLNKPPNGPKMWDFLDTVTIYPDQATK